MNAAAPNGTGVITVSVDVLPLFLASLPSTFKVIGSLRSETAETVRLLLSSREVSPDRLVELAMVVEDRGTTRTITVRHG